MSHCRFLQVTLAYSIKSTTSKANGAAGLVMMHCSLKEPAY